MIWLPVMGSSVTVTCSNWAAKKAGSTAAPSRPASRVWTAIMWSARCSTDGTTPWALANRAKARPRAECAGALIHGRPERSAAVAGGSQPAGTTTR